MPYLFSFRTRSGKVRHVLSELTLDEGLRRTATAALAATNGRLFSPGYHKRDNKSLEINIKTPIRNRQIPQNTK